MNRSIDLNADVGERPEAIADGREEEILRLVTSANIACGGHAGTTETMAHVVTMALRHGVAIGAHPGYPDPQNFGRIEVSLPAEELERTIAAQVAALAGIARAQGATLRHIKAHGALYNVAVRDQRLAATIAHALLPWRKDCLLFGLAGSAMLQTWAERGFRVVGEAFADRRYEADGSLRARRHPDALIDDPAAAAEQAADIVLGGRVVAVTGASVPIAAETLCVHGDTPGAVQILRAIRNELARLGVEVRSCR
jgi:UPF0271 protein